MLTIALSLSACGGAEGGLDHACHPTEHDWVETGRSSASCDYAGSISLECRKCGDVSQEQIPQKNHDFVIDKSESRNPTCEDKGYNRYECTLCDAWYEEETDRLVHNYKVDTYVAPTCTESGYINKTCARCEGSVYEYLPPPYEHVLGTAEAQAPTCTEEGWETYEYCKRCDWSEKSNALIAPLNHDMDEGWTVDLQPTDNSTGLRSHHCLRQNCDFTENQTEIPKLGYSDFLTYTVSGNSVTVTGIATGHESDSPIISIPEEYGGLPVKYIAQNAFAGNGNISIVKIPASVVNIYRNAFSGCSSLTTVDIAEGSDLWHIDVEAFAYCYELSHINLPEGLAQIDKKAFYSCGFTEIVIPDSVSMVCLGAFQGCSELRSITIPKLYDEATDVYSETLWLGFIFGATDPNASTYIPSGLETVTFTKITSISSDALRACGNIKYLSLPDTLESVAPDAFLYCYELVYNVSGGVNYLGNSKNMFMLLVGASDKTLTTYTLESSKYILAGAFEGCEALQSITIPEGTLEIGASAFAGCSALVSVNFADSILKIGNNAFDGCVKLGSISLPESLVTIGSYAFRNCYEVSNRVVIHENVRSFGLGSFHNVGSSSLGFTLEFEVTEGWRNVYGQAVSSTFLSNIANTTAVFTNDGSNSGYAEAYYMSR